MVALEQWIAVKGLSRTQVARALELGSKSSVGRVIRKRGASADLVRRIYDFTSGEVTPNDIFGLHPPAVPGGDHGP